ncbi:MAG: hypothetical protein ACFCU3_09755 [Verrucomicrobiales bacterium]
MDFPQSGEYIIVSGGPSIHRWERFRSVPHDRWWGNFIRTARVRMEAIRQERGPDLPIGWLVYKPAFVTRSQQDQRPLIEFIESVRDRHGCNLIFFSETQQVINYINRGNNRSRLPVIGFEFFGHSNKAAFMFDYSNHIDGASKVWLHESELGKINRSAFHRRAYIKSWGCHTGESFSQSWRKVIGVPMVGAIGKTDYSPGYVPVLSSPGGRWVR